MRMYEEGVDFRTALLADAELTGVLSRAEIEACFSPEDHLRNVDAIFQRVFGRTH